MRDIYIYDTLSQSKKKFTPIRPQHVGLYVCGMTVYDHCHIGHARVFVVFDVIVRYLRMCGYNVRYVRNITDIDDKIIARAHKEGRSYQSLTEQYIQVMHEDERQLGILMPTLEPRATEHITAMINLIQGLIEKGLAYRVASGDVYYHVPKFKKYGQLAGQSLEKLHVGERIAVDPQKKHSLDFVLWKAAKLDEPSWISPFGDGRPGWHIECSAMSMQLLGDTFDIHGGGVDLKFPHHQNEIAQSEGISEKILTHHWMHVGHVKLNAEKISKSKGNFFTIRSLLREHHAEVLRYFLLASHYRHPLDYTEIRLKQAHTMMQRCYLALRDSADLVINSKKGKGYVTTSYIDNFHRAMCDDFNTPLALTVLYDLVREINRLRVTQHNYEALLHRQQLLMLAEPLGLFQQPPVEFLQASGKSNVPVELLKDQDVIKQLAEREQARKQKDWKRADEIRKSLAKSGIILEDTAQGSKWRRI